MQYTPQEIKAKLLRALDEENNVLDAEAVMEVISILEKYPITKEHLETTRIGRHINELRKKTSNEQLAKRAKNLVRSWHRLLNEPEKSGVNGERVVTPPVSSSVAALQVIGKTSRPSTPYATSSPSVNRSNTPINLIKKSSLSSAPSPTSSVSNASPRLPNRGVGESLKKQTSSGGCVSKSSSPALPRAVNPLQATKPIPSRDMSPSVLHGKMTSPGVNSAGSLGISARAVSPHISNLMRSEGPSSSKYSPKLNSASQALQPHVNSPQVPPTVVSGGNDDSNLSWSTTSPTSVNSDFCKDLQLDSSLRLSKAEGELSRNNKHIHKSNHSSESVHKSGVKGSELYSTNISKADKANRKRTRPESPWSLAAKKQKISEISSLSAAPGDETFNGIRKGCDKNRNGEKNKWVSVEFDRSGTPDSSASESQNFNKRALFAIRTPSVSSDTSSKLPKTPKVKTTAQIIADLQQRVGASVGNDIIEKLNTNQIVKEQDIQNSFLPDGVKPRPRKTKDLVDSVPMSQTKTEMVEKFLQSVNPLQQEEDFSPYALKPESPDDFIICGPESVAPCDLQTSMEVRVNDECKKESNTEDSKSLHPKIPSLDDIYSQLSPLDVSSIDWGSLDYSLPTTPHPVTDEVVKQVHSEHVPGVNGCYDPLGQWHDWTETYTVFYRENDRRMHVLPYVVTD